MEIDRPIAIAVTLFIILLVFFYLFLPQYREVEDLQAEIMSGRAELADRENYFESIVDNYRKLIENEENLMKINTAVLPDPSIPSLVYFLEEKSNENGLILRELNLGQIDYTGEEVKSAKFSFLLTGSYSGFRPFLQSLETSSRLIDIEKISFEVEDYGRIYDFELDIKIYFN